LICTVVSLGVLKILINNFLRDQSLLMLGRGLEEILRGHKKFLTSEGGARKCFEHERGGGQKIWNSL
jgi:hypothetical protein